MTRWFVLDLNPEAWRVGPLGVGKKNGKYFPYVGRDQQLDTYKKAVQELLGEHVPTTANVKLTLLFWRNRPKYVTVQARTAHKNEIDLTNAIKSTEDAIQKVLINNDRQTVAIEAYMVEQGEDVSGRIVLGIEDAPTIPDILNVLPPEVYAQLGDHPALFDMEASTDSEDDKYASAGDDF